MQVAAGSDHVLFVQVTVMLEVEWVVRAVFGFDKTVVLGACACWAPRESVQAACA